MIATNRVPASGKGTMARIRRASSGRYTLMLSRQGVPGHGRVFFAYSLRHLAQLLKLHVPGWANAAKAGAGALATAA